MRMFKISLALLLVVLLAISPQLALAGKGPNVKGGPIKEKDWMEEPKAAPLSAERPAAQWIQSWYVPDGGYMNNGGFGPSAPIDHIDEATKGKLTQPKLSTIDGLLSTQNIKVLFNEKKGHWMEGSTGEWICVTFGPEDKSVGDDAKGRNMSSRYGLKDTSNFDTWQIIVIKAPADMKAIMSPAQDDHAQIWINGDKWHNDSKWTGHPTKVNFDVEVKLKAGGNVLLYRCGESGGHDYANLHFDEATMKKVKIFPTKAAKTQADFFNEARGALSVGPMDKLSTSWGDIKTSEW